MDCTVITVSPLPRKLGATPSAFIAAFRKNFGTTPGNCFD